MAIQRLVNTNFWKDTYVIELDPVQKLLFLYFLTNPRTTLAGVYELSIREAAFDTGIDKDMVEKILAKFCADGKMHYEKGWLILRNFVKHQRINPSISKGIERAVAELPKWLQIVVEDFSSYYDQQGSETPDSPQTVDSLVQTGTSLPPTKLNLTKLNLTKLNLTKLNSNPPTPHTKLELVPSEKIDAMFRAWKDATGYDVAGLGNRKACAALYRQYGQEKLHQLILGVAQSHDDQYAPRIADFVGLKRKVNDLILWGRKKQQVKPGGFFKV